MPQKSESQVLFTLKNLGVLLCLFMVLVSCGGGTVVEPFKIKIEVMGLPEGIKGDVTVTGPSNFNETITETKMFTNLAEGEYKIIAKDVINEDKTHFVYVVNGSATIDQSERTFFPDRDLEIIQVKYELEAELSITVRGLPSGVNAEVTVKGVNVIGKSEVVEQKVTSSITLGDLRPGIYEIAVAEVSSNYIYAPIVTSFGEQLEPGSQTSTEIAYLTEINSLQNTSGGNSVVIDGGIMTLGLLKADDSDGDGVVDGNCDYSIAYGIYGKCTGSVSILERGNDGSWFLVKELTSGKLSDSFGYSLAMSGDTLVVGAPQDDSNGNTFDDPEGAVYIFQRNQGGNNNWGLIKKIVFRKDSVDGPDSQFGRSIALDSDTLIVGAYRDSPDANGDEIWACRTGRDVSECGVGSASIYQRDRGGVNNWGLVKKLSPSDAVRDDYFGFDVDISGDTVVIGAIQLGPSQQSDARPGAAYVFNRNRGGNDNWGEVKKLEPGDNTVYNADLNFGSSVAIENGRIAVSVPNDSADVDGNGSIDCDLSKGVKGSECFKGSIRIFEQNEGGNNVWGQAEILAIVGETLELSEGMLLVGVPDTSKNSRSYVGAVYALRQENSKWNVYQGFTPSVGSESDYFGSALAADQGRIVIASPGYNGNEGTFYIFE
jgi:FG-GAP repeat